MKIAITGHRPNKLGNDYILKSPLILKIKAKLQQIIDEKKPEVMLSGMALGIDTLWALLAIENKIPLLACLPFKDQDSKWPPQSRKVWRDILNHPLTTKVIVSEGEYSAHKMQLRNEFMVNNCDLLVAVWDGTGGGTGNCVAYAQSPLVNMDIIVIDPNQV